MRKLVAVTALLASQVCFAGGFVDQLAQYHLNRQMRIEEGTFSPDWILSWASAPLNATAPADVAASSEGVFNQKIDPSNPSDTRTFAQRYFFNSAYASGPDAPVFYYICGEAVCDAPSGAALAYAHQYRGYVVSLEHRFYGDSQPFPTLSNENLKYLRTDFALADLANFQAFAKAKWGLKGKWIAMGGSYPGSLSAYYRLKYPSLVVGSLASSAPVQPRENFEEYDWVVHDRAGSACASQIQQVVAQLENLMRTDAQGFAAAKLKFEAESVQDPVDFLYVVADMAASAVQYGMKDQFCSSLANGGSDLIGAYARAGIQAFSRLGMKPADDSFQVAKNEDPATYHLGVGTRQWLYQSCTEYGYFQNAYHDPSQSARTALINPAFHRRVCQELFGTQALDVSNIEHNYYEPLLNPASASRIVFTNGSVDPWAMLSISNELGNAVNPNVATYTIQGAAHCGDLGTPNFTDSSSLKGAQRLFTSSVEQWLR
jgi:pimeloyl-ACP methyl ester carboxylesterase